jgi:hypothetical protein
MWVTTGTCPVSRIICELQQELVQCLVSLVSHNRNLSSVSYRRWVTTRACPVSRLIATRQLSDLPAYLPLTVNCSHLDSKSYGCSAVLQGKEGPSFRDILLLLSSEWINLLFYCFTLKMKPLRSFETSGTTPSTIQKISLKQNSCAELKCGNTVHDGRRVLDSVDVTALVHRTGFNSCGYRTYW